MSKTRERLWFALFTVPTILIFITVVIIPFINGIVLAFFEWDGIAANPKIFVGLENFVKLWSDQRFLSSAFITIKFTVLAVISVNVLGLIFALLCTSALKMKNLARMMIFMPNLIGGLILGYIWQFIFTDAFAILGELTGFDQVFFNWLLDKDYALYAIIFVFTWQMAGYMMIVYIAGIQSIPDELMEAAKIDGANYWQRLRHIVLPLLMPAITICLFLTLSFAFKQYDVNLSLTGGGPVRATEMFAMHIYNEIFRYNNYGYGQAKAIIFFIIIAVISLTQVYLTKKREVEM